jgi:protein-disulfide isomerase
MTTFASSGLIRTVATGAVCLALGAALAIMVQQPHAPTVDVDQIALELHKRDFVAKELSDRPSMLQDAVRKFQAQAQAQSEARDTTADQRRRAEDPIHAVVIPAQEKALVTVVQLSDYNCPYCRSAAKMVERIIAEQKDVRLVFRELPVIHPPESRRTAEIAYAIAKQGKYLDFYSKTMIEPGLVDEKRALAIATELGADMAKLETDRKSDETKAAIEENLSLAHELQIGGTPTFIINGKTVSGAIPYEAFTKALDDARAKVERAKG